MKQLLITIAALVLVGCGETQPPETLTAKAPDIDIHVATLGNIEAVRQHIAAGTDVNAKSQDGATPLHMAAWNDLNEVAELLIANGADVNAKNDWGSTPLHGAGESSKEFVELLIAAGADVNAKDDDGSTPLHHAAGNKEIVELLIANGANVSAKSDDGKTPLHRAAYRGYKETVELLIANGAGVSTRDGDGKTPLDFAEKEMFNKPRNKNLIPVIKANKKETADLLRKHGGY